MLSKEFFHGQELVLESRKRIVFKNRLKSLLLNSMRHQRDSLEKSQELRAITISLKQL